MNYEALGRYTEAKEKLAQLQIERNHLALRVKHLVSVAEGISLGSTLSLVDMSSIHEVVRQLDVKNEEMAALAKNHNQAAGEIGRSLLRIT